MLKVKLQPGLIDGKWAYLRPLCGRDELLVDATKAFMATEFLDQLLVNSPGTTVGPGKAWDLAVCDRDRILAAIYIHYFGETVESTIPCDNCKEDFEVKFTLQDLISNLEGTDVKNITGPDKNGVYKMENGLDFRLPTSADLVRVAGLEPAEELSALLDSCILNNNDRAVDSTAVQGAMAAVGPVIDTNMDTNCPDCGTPRCVHFDIQAYLIQALAYEKRFLAREIHRVAAGYGWGLNEILDLSREDRRTYVRLIEADHVNSRSRWS